METFLKFKSCNLICNVQNCCVYKCNLLIEPFFFELCSSFLSYLTNKELNQATFLTTLTPTGRESSRYRWSVIATAVLVRSHERETSRKTKFALLIFFCPKLPPPPPPNLKYLALYSSFYFSICCIIGH